MGPVSRQMGYLGIASGVEVQIVYVSVCVPLSAS